MRGIDPVMSISGTIMNPHTSEPPLLTWMARSMTRWIGRKLATAKDHLRFCWTTRSTLGRATRCVMLLLVILLPGLAFLPGVALALWLPIVYVQQRLVRYLNLSIARPFPSYFGEMLLWTEVVLVIGFRWVMAENGAASVFNAPFIALMSAPYLMAGVA